MKHFLLQNIKKWTPQKNEKRPPVKAKRKDDKNGSKEGQTYRAGGF